MAFVNCHLCKSKQFTDVATFNLHLKISHQGCQRYVCTVDNCNRSYNLWGSFSSHLVTFHEIPRHQINLTPAVIVPNDDVSGSGSSDQCNDGNEQIVETAPPIEMKALKQMLLKQQNLIVAKLYANPGFPRNLVDKVIKDFSEYLSSPFFDHLEKVVLSSLSPECPEKKDIQEMFELVRNPFAHLNTEHKRFAYFENTGDFIKPVPYDISVREERTKKNSEIGLGMKPVQGQVIPLGPLLKSFFELPYALSDTLSYMKSLEKETNWISNFIQCEVWKRKRSNFDPQAIVIPVNFYFDEYEPNNVLGSHSDPLGCSYIHIPCLPPEWSSKLENIFLAYLFDGHNRPIYGNKRVFTPVIKEFIKLETNGVIVCSAELGDVQVYFVMGLILGDNKALHEICGFSAFNANFYCRICVGAKEICHKMVTENAALIRTTTRYENDVKAKNPEVTGVKEQCVFSVIPAFQAPTDICVDEFHDVIEGVAHYTMIPVLNHFHSLNNTFLSTLNSRMYCIDLGIDDDNRPPLINADRLSKDKLKMSGSEMYTFVRLFGVLVLDMVPVDDLYYKLYLLLHDIVSFVKARGLPRNAGEKFQVTVKEHHELYMSLTKETLKPKHHFLVHYPGLFSQFGPFAPLSTIRFEAKHKTLKMTSNVCNSRKNLSKTVAIKQQLAHCFRSLAQSSPRHSMLVGSVNLVDLRDLLEYPAFRPTLPENVVNEPHQNLSKWVDYRGTRYSLKQVLVTGVDDVGQFLFGVIKLIIVLEERPLFICEPYETLGHFNMVRGYELKRSEDGCFAVEHSKLFDPYPLCLFTLATGETVVIPK